MPPPILPTSDTNIKCAIAWRIALLIMEDEWVYLNSAKVSLGFCYDVKQQPREVSLQGD